MNFRVSSSSLRPTQSNNRYFHDRDGGHRHFRNAEMSFRNTTQIQADHEPRIPRAVFSRTAREVQPELRVAPSPFGERFSEGNETLLHALDQTWRYYFFKVVKR